MYSQHTGRERETSLICKRRKRLATTTVFDRHKSCQNVQRKTFFFDLCADSRKVTLTVSELENWTFRNCGSHKTRPAPMRAFKVGSDHTKSCYRKIFSMKWKNLTQPIENLLTLSKVTAAVSKSSLGMFHSNFQRRCLEMRRSIKEGRAKEHRKANETP